LQISSASTDTDGNGAPTPAGRSRPTTTRSHVDTCGGSYLGFASRSDLVDSKGVSRVTPRKEHCTVGRIPHRGMGRDEQRNHQTTDERTKGAAMSAMATNTSHPASPAPSDHSAGPPDSSREHGPHGNYGRFGLMVVASMAAMFILTYVNTYHMDHVEFSETRFFMTFVMGAAMAVIMLLFMRGMYRNKILNRSIYLGSLIVFALAIWLVRSQATVDDRSYMRAMIPHHSIAILTSKNADIDDVRVRELAQGIIEAQEREIEEMKWLIEDIHRNGEATTDAEAADRPVPEFSPNY